MELRGVEVGEACQKQRTANPISHFKTRFYSFNPLTPDIVRKNHITVLGFYPSWVL